MPHFPARAWRSAATLVAAAMAAACGSDDPAGTECEVQSVTVTGLPAELPALQPVALTATIQSSGCSGLTPTWSASQGLSISPQGEVVGQALGGPLTVTATVNGVSGTAETTVVEAAAVPDDRWAIAWMSGPNADYTPPLDGYPYATTTGTTLTKQRTGAGEYRVTFGGLAPAPGQREAILVSAYGGTPRRCRVLSWGSQGADLVAEVRCHDYNGEPADAWFVIALHPAGATTGRSAFFTSPDEDGLVMAATTFNSQGQPVAFTSNGSGMYTVRFEGLSRGVPGSVKEAFHVTSFGEGTNWCKIVQWSTTANPVESISLIVQCYDVAGNPADGRFSVTMFEGPRAGIHRLGFLWANDPSAASYTPSATYNHTSGGGLNTMTRSGPGDYLVGWTNLLRPEATVAEVNFVTAYGNDARDCQLWTWSENSVRVLCFDPDGTPADSRSVPIVVE